MKILRQDTGRFDRRFSVGPAQWDFFDLLWIDEGSITLTIGTAKNRLDIDAPSGVLISPGSIFQGEVKSEQASASIIHFSDTDHAWPTENEFLIPPKSDVLHIQNLIRLSLSYAFRGEMMDKRQRLLTVILDCFSGIAEVDEHMNRLTNAWKEARQKLDRVRGIADVAAFAGLSESTFRALHRDQMKGSAGRHLRDMRLNEAERLLATTGLSLRELSKMVGYGHAESFSAAFSKSRGRTPGAYRKWCSRFA